MQQNNKKSYVELKKAVQYFFDSYKNVEQRLVIVNYDSRYHNVDEQCIIDAETLAHIQCLLSTCTKETYDFIMNTYLHPENGGSYYKGLSRSTIYRLNKKAIIEIANCLKL